MAERLHFNSQMAYESMLAAEHLARYWLVKDACKGKRVLDVACGEGYGSSLLKKWGAASVVGVDISQETIANAAERFGIEGISYRAGDACNLSSVLSEDESFDLVVSFETMEHVPDVPGLLHGIKKYLARGGSIAISCPNDSEIASEETNEFHLKVYSYEEFKNTTTAVLGDAAQWLLGTPVLGFGVCASTDQWAQEAAPSLSMMLEGADVESAHLLPVQAGHEVNAARAFFYVGVWGAELPRTLIAAPIAYRAYTGPWNNWIASKAENERLLAEQASDKQSYAAAAGQQAAELDSVREQLGNIGQELERLESEIKARKVQIASERSVRLVMASKLHDRDMQYRQLTENLRLSEQRVAALENSAHTAENALRAAEGRIHQMDDAHAAVTAERESLNERLQVVSKSRGYRAVQSYYRLYEHRATRWFMQPARRLAALVRRILA